MSTTYTRYRVAMIRPYLDEETTTRIIAALDRAGGDLVRTFADPVDAAALGAYLEGEGRDDRLVIPWHGDEDPEALRLVAELQQAAGVRRRLLVPVKTGSVVVVRQRIEKALSSEARSRVMTQVFDQLVSPIAKPILSRHLEYKQIGHLS